MHLHPHRLHYFLDFRSLLMISHSKWSSYRRVRRWTSELMMISMIAVRAWMSDSATTPIGLLLFDYDKTHRQRRSVLWKMLFSTVPALNDNKNDNSKASNSTFLTKHLPVCRLLFVYDLLQCALLGVVYLFSPLFLLIQWAHWNDVLHHRHQVCRPILPVTDALVESSWRSSVSKVSFLTFECFSFPSFSIGLVELNFHWSSCILERYGGKN